MNGTQERAALLRIDEIASWAELLRDSGLADTQLYAAICVQWEEACRDLVRAGEEEEKCHA